MRILSLFDGISCAQVALEKAGIQIDEYYASEIDKTAIIITQKNYPDTIQVGDITELNSSPFSNIDLIVGGSPCQDLSIAKRNRTGLSGGRSCLFYNFAKMLFEIKPKYFILENVKSMPKDSKNEITEILGVKPIMIDAALVSAQMRKRLFWIGALTERGNYKQVIIPLPEDRKIMLKDILLDETYTEYDKAYALTATYSRAVYYEQIEKHQRTMVWKTPIRVGIFNKGGQGRRVYSINGKSVTLQANGGGWGAKTGLYEFKDYARKLEPIECERLQGLPDDYTKIENISKNSRLKHLGNAFNTDVVAHILLGLDKNMEI